jgi:RNA polymerase primary sigma factor
LIRYIYIKTLSAFPVFNNERVLHMPFHSHTLDLYRRDLDHTPEPLSRQQEATATPDDLVKANLRYAYAIARSFEGRGVPIEDLIQQASLGLIEAAKRFDPSRGFKFITYARWWIRQMILKVVEDPAPVHLPANLCATGHRVQIQSLDISTFGEEEPSPKDLLLDEDMLPDRVTEEKDLVFFVAQALEGLPDRERDVLSKYFGLEGEEYTLEAIGDQMGVSRERVRQIKEGALRRLWMEPM